MKFYSKIFAVAVLGMAAACTSKEAEPEIPGTEPVAGRESVTFTATIPSSKGYDNQGKMTWEVGDIILLWTNNIAWTSGLALTTSNYNTGAYAGKFDVVTVTEGMFTDGTRKTISFSIDSEILPAQSPSPTRYFAVTTHDLGLLYHCANGSVSTVASKLSTVYAGTRPHFAVASCSSSETSLTFNNVATVFQWDTDGTEITRIEMVVPDGSDADTRFGARFTAFYDAGSDTWGFTNAPNASADPTTITSFTNPNGGVRQAGPYYIMLAPGMTYANGFKFKIYTSSGLLLTMVPTTSSFTTAAGDFWDFGKLEDHFDKYYDRWMAGADIEIGGITYNKSTFAGTTHHITTNTDLNTIDGNGDIYFIDEGATLTTRTEGGFSGELIFVGNMVGTRSTVTNAVPPLTNASWLMKNIDITTTAASDKKFVGLGAGAIDKLVIDDCKLYFDRTFCNRTTSDKSVNVFTLVDSDILVASSSPDSFLYTHTGDGQAFGAIKVTNNVFWTNDDTFKAIGIVDIPWSASGANIGSIAFENNTFYNVGTKTDGSRDFFMFNTVTSSISVKSNLYYTSTEANTDGSKGHISVLRARGLTSSETWALASANNVNSFTNYAWNRAVIGSDSNSLWGNGLSKDTSANPFTSFNVSDGTFVIKEEYKSFGATR